MHQQKSDTLLKDILKKKVLDIKCYYDYPMTEDILKKKVLDIKCYYDYPMTAIKQNSILMLYHASKLLSL